MKSLDKLENAYITIFENTGAGTILIDADTTIVLANSKFGKMLGYDKNDVEGKMSWTEFIYEEDVERMKMYHYLRRKDPDAAPKNYEFRIYTKDRQLRYMYLTIDMIPGTDLSIASLTDITPLVLTREQLQKSEEKYRLLVETMNDGLLVQDDTFKITYVNPRFCEIIGYPPDAIIGKTIKDFIHPDCFHRFDSQMQKRSAGIQETYELSWVKSDGTIAYTIVSPRIISDGQRVFAGSFAVITDITERKKWEETLQQSEELFAKVFDSTPVGLALINVETGEILKVNKSFSDSTGILKDDASTKSIWDTRFIKKKDIETIIQNLRDGIPITDYEIRINTVNKESIAIVSAQAIAIRGVTLAILTLTDITEKRILEKEIISISDRERRTIGQDLHDDLIPHLIGIDSMCKAMLMSLEKNSTISKEDIVHIRSLLNEAIHKTRQFSKGLTPGYFIANRGLTALIEELALNTQHIYGIHCNVEQHGNILIHNPFIMTHVYHIIQEAVHNAVKHSKAQEITITIHSEEDVVSIQVQDNGCGFDTSQSMGMGLKIMQHRAMVIGADLQIQSKIGEYTKIILTMPNKGA